MRRSRAMFRPGLTSLLLRLGLLLAGLALAGCAPPALERGLPPTPVVAGARVLAPWSKRPHLFKGRVKEQHGRLVLVEFDDGDRGWADASQLYPPGLPEPEPAGPASPVPTGTPVLARRSRVGTVLFPGTVAELYGRLALVSFDDGELHWIAQAELSVPAKPVVEPAAPVHAGLSPPPIGGKVVAPLVPGAKPGPARVAELAGKLAHLYFEDGGEAWVDVATLVPPAGPGPIPQGHGFHSPGAEVEVPLGRRGSWVPAVVEESYAGLIRVTFAGGAAGGWLHGWEARRRGGGSATLPPP